MKKLLLLFALVAAFVLQANANIYIRIQADIPEGQDLYIHAWVNNGNGDVDLTTWPGNKLFSYETPKGDKYYYYTTDIQPARINFLLHRGTPNGGEQVIGKTADFIGAIDGDVFEYQNDGTLTRKTLEMFDLPKFLSNQIVSELETQNNYAYFAVPGDWDITEGVGAWAYTDGVGKMTTQEWPGDKMTFIIDQDNWKFYRWIQDDNVTGDPQNIIFNNNIAQGATQSTTYDFVNHGIYIGNFGMAGVVPDLSVAINNTNFPDSIFRAYVKSTFDKDDNDALSLYELSLATTLNVDNKKIFNVEGLNKLVFLQNVTLSNNPITSVDLTGLTELVELNVASTQVNSLNLTDATDLRKLDCEYSDIKQLDVTPCTKLTSLECSYSGVSQLNITGCTKITRLECSNSNLTTLNVSQCPKLNYLDCENNRITNLNFDGCSNISTLKCSGNILTSLDVTGCPNLTILECDGASEIDLTRSISEVSELFDLEEFINIYNVYFNEVKGNAIQTLNLSNCPLLTELSCEGNQLTTLDVSPCTNLSRLHASGNKLTSVNLGNLTNLYELELSNNNLTSISGLSNNTGISKLELENNPIADFASLGVANTQLTTLNLVGVDLSNVNSLASLLPTSLTKLSISDCKLTSLDVSALTSLESLFCSSNNIQALNLSGLTNLINLSANSCGLDNSTLTLPANATNLKFLSLKDNELKSLDLSAYTKLRTIFVNNNSLEQLTLPTLTSDADQSYVDCSYNSLTALDAKNYANVAASHNLISSFTATQGTILCPDLAYNKLSYIDLEGHNVLPIITLLTSLPELVGNDISMGNFTEVATSWPSDSRKSMLHMLAYYMKSLTRGEFCGQMWHQLIIFIIADAYISNGVIDIQMSIDNNGHDPITVDSRNQDGKSVYYIRINKQDEADGAPMGGPHRERGYLDTDEMLGVGFDYSKMEIISGGEIVTDEYGTYLSLTPTSGNDGNAYGTVTYKYDSGFDKDANIEAIRAQGDFTDEQLEVLESKIPDFNETIYSFEWDAVSPTAIEIVKAGNAKEISRIYYNSLGQASSTPHNGLNVIVKTYDNGTKQVEKQMFK